MFGDPEDLDGDDDDGDGDGDGDDDDDDDDEEDDDDDDDDDDDGDGEDDDDVAATDASVGGSVAVPTSSLPAVPTPTIPTPSLPTGSIPPSADAPPEAEKDTTTKVDAMAPQLARRSLFVPKATRQGISIEAIVGIPIPSPVHCIASTACLSYLLTGSQDGYVRAYDFWASVNGGQVMTAQQRAVVGLGEGVNKAGVGRGWWAVEVPEARASTPVPGAAGASAGAGGAATGTATPGGKKQEPVYSLACDPDGLWSAAGTQSGDINLYSLRHSPGTLLTSLRGHSNVVSCMQLVDDTSLLSGSWDGVVRVSLLIFWRADIRNGTSILAKQHERILGTAPRSLLSLCGRQSSALPPRYRSTSARTSSRKTGKPTKSTGLRTAPKQLTETWR